MAGRNNWRGKLLVDLSTGNVSIEKNADEFVSNAYDPTVDYKNPQQIINNTNDDLTSNNEEYQEQSPRSIVQHKSIIMHNNIEPPEPMLIENNYEANHAFESCEHDVETVPTHSNKSDCIPNDVTGLLEPINVTDRQTWILNDQTGVQHIERPEPMLVENDCDTNHASKSCEHDDAAVPKHSNENEFILNDVTGLMEPKTITYGQTWILNDQTGEFDKCCQEEDIQESDSENFAEMYDKRRDRKYNMMKRLKGEQYVGRKKVHKKDKTENDQKEKDKTEEDKKEEDKNEKESFVLKKKRRIKSKTCNHDSCTIKTSRSFQCGMINEEQRKLIFQYFWDLETWEAKKAYIKNLVRMRPVIRRRKTSRAASSKKQQGFDWFLPNENNEMVKVCKNFMLSTIDINNDTLWDWINTMFEDEQINRPGSSTSHKRSSKTKNDATSNNRSELRKASAIEEWLNLLPKVPSHYCRSSSTRTYVEDSFRNKTHMYRVFKKWCLSKNKPFSQRKLFCKILKEKKISIFKPRKDQCDTCTAFKEGNLAEDEYNKHINMKQEAYLAKEQATALCSSEVLVVTVDVQSVLLCPKLQVSVQYYKQKLQMHNYTIYCNNDGEVHLYVWHEGDGGVTANEFTTCLIDFLRQKATEGFKKMIIISDGCCYQNRNKTLSSALLNLSREKELDIEQLILEKGHTMMQVDSVHSTLEGLFKPPIYSPSHYVSLMAQARHSKPYIIHNVDYTFFKNYEDVCQLDSIRPGKKAGDPVVTDLRAALYKGGEIFYKLRQTDEWQLLPQRLHNNDKDLVDLYVEPRKIEKSKYDSLQSLKKYMHRDNHFFYDNLKFN